MNTPERSFADAFHDAHTALLRDLQELEKAVREFVREKEAEAGSNWFVAEGATPLSDGQIRRYQTTADKLMLASHERSRKKLFRRHSAQRRNLYARAVTTGDLQTALACLRDEAKLLGLYPSTKHEVTGERGGPIRFSLEEAVAADRELEEAERDALHRGGSPPLPDRSP
jgi:hypothetical protein